MSRPKYKICLITKGDKDLVFEHTGLYLGALKKARRYVAKYQALSFVICRLYQDSAGYSYWVDVEKVGDYEI